LALIISDIARRDFPKEWGTLFQDLVKIISSGNQLQQKRGMKALLYCVRSLASKKLMEGKQQFQSISQELIKYIGLTLWTNSCTELINQASSLDTNNSILPEIVTYSLKIMQTSIAHSGTIIYKNQNTTSFLESLIVQTQLIIQLYSFAEEKKFSFETKKKIGKIIKSTLDLLLQIHESCDVSFSSLVKPSLQFSLSLWFSSFQLFLKREMERNDISPSKLSTQDTPDFVNAKITTLCLD
jgi:hypothetical protein